MTPEESAYVAGFVDGEGCISIVKRKPYRSCKSTTYALSFMITNTNLNVLKYIQSLLGVGTIIKKDTTKYPKWKSCYNYQVCSEQALEVLKVIEPHLVLKKEQAQLAIKYQSEPSENNGKNGNSIEYTSKQEEYYLQMRALK